jgi:hypothetical protein
MSNTTWARSARRLLQKIERSANISHNSLNRAMRNGPGSARGVEDRRRAETAMGELRAQAKGLYDLLEHFEAHEGLPADLERVDV